MWPWYALQIEKKFRSFLDLDTSVYYNIQINITWFVKMDTLFYKVHYLFWGLGYFSLRKDTDYRAELRFLFFASKHYFEVFMSLIYHLLSPATLLSATSKSCAELRSPKITKCNCFTLLSTSGNPFCTWVLFMLWCMP